MTWWTSEHTLERIVLDQLVFLVLNRSSIVLIHLVMCGNMIIVLTTSKGSLLSEEGICSLAFVPVVLLQQLDNLVNVVNIQHGLEIHDCHAHLVVAWPLTMKKLVLQVFVHFPENNIIFCG